MSKVVAAFLAMAPWIVYAVENAGNRDWWSALGCLAGLISVFYLIWFRLEEVD